MRITPILLALVLTACAQKDYTPTPEEMNAAQASAAAEAGPSLDELHRESVRKDEEYKQMCKADPASVYC